MCYEINFNLSLRMYNTLYLSFLWHLEVPCACHWLVEHGDALQIVLKINKGKGASCWLERVERMKKMK